MALKDFLVIPNFKEMRKARDLGKISYAEYEALSYVLAMRYPSPVTKLPKLSELEPEIRTIVESLS